MAIHNSAEIITIGSELLLPDAAESNSSFISRILFSLGIPVQFKTVVGDFEKDIARSILTALKRSKWVFLTGGLGPTEDDVTRQAAAAALGRALTLNKKTLEQIKKKFVKRGRQFLNIHEHQAWFPKKSVLIPNENGVAPGFILKEKGAFLISLPGVPAEMRQMTQTTVSSFILKNRGGKSGQNTLFFKKYKTFGITESSVNETLKDLMATENVIFGLLAKGTGVEISLMIKDKKPIKVDQKRKEMDKAIKNRLKNLIYGEDDQTLEEIVGQQLKKKRQTLSVAESCTGGLISHRITNVPGSSTYFNNSTITYSNASKIKLLGVPAQLIKKYGAVSPRVAMAMAQGVRKTGQSDIGIAVTGIAGPGGGSIRKPAGLVYLGLSDQKGLFWEEARYFGDREAFKWLASSKALDMLRLRLTVY
ncbi:MAG: competence/damage-inducible protein A [Nitrospiria bacterium]